MTKKLLTSFVALCVFMCGALAIHFVMSPNSDALTVARLTTSFSRDHAPHMDWARVSIVSTAKTAAHSGSAEADWAAGRCDIVIDPAMVDKNWGATDGSATPLQFVALHEMGHCHLYSTPHLGWRDAGYAGSAPEGLLDELWAMDASVVGVEDRGGMNWFSLGHEAFADAFAMAWLVQKGTKPNALMGIVQKREADAFGDRAHNVAPAGRFALSDSWAGKGWSAERVGRAGAAQVVLGTGFSNLLTLDPEAMRQLIAASWCQWTQIKEGQDFAAEAYNYYLGRVGAPAQKGMLMSATSWTAPMPDLVMPRFALSKLRTGVKTPQESEACAQEGAALLRIRHPG